MTFATLALISAVAVLGPLLALPRQWYLPVMLGELLAGVLLGQSGVGVLHPRDRTFAFLANIGFALIMFAAGTRVPVRDPRLLGGVRIGVARAAAVAVLAVPLATFIAFGFGTSHAALYVVLLASSSAAVVLPIVDSLGLQGERILALLPQVAVADAACTLALPIAIDTAHAGRAALGAAAVIAGTIVAFLAFRYLERSGIRKRVHRVSEQRKFALEMRVNLVVLFALAALATTTHVSIMLAGFGLGLAVAAVGEPRRLARQVFALTEGFLGPLFFVWLGASLNVRDLAHRPSFVLLGLALGAGAVATHVAMRATGQPVAVGCLAASQLGVPVAAATLGAQLRLLAPGEGAALILGMLVTVAAAIAATAVAERHHRATPNNLSDGRTA